MANAGAAAAAAFQARESRVQGGTAEEVLHAGEDDDFNEDMAAITEFKIPEWAEICLAITGISELQYKIEEERERRADEYYQNPHPEINAIVASMNFEVTVALVIVLNCAILGWEMSVPDGEMEGLFSLFEHFFTAFFLVEWILRVIAYGWVWIFEAANMADTVLVFGTGVFIKWFAEPVGLDVGGLRILTVFRSLRLVRLAHAVHLNPTYKEMWILIHGLVTSARPLTWTMVIGSSVMYVFAVAGTELVGKSDKFKDDEYAQELFGNFMRSMFTMLQLITLDTYFTEVIRPITDVQPYLAIFFVLFIAIGVFVVLNLITAIIVQNAEDIRKDDKDSLARDAIEAKKNELKHLTELFLEIDADGSGELTREEFFGALGNKKVRDMLDVLEMKVSELQETWEVLDDGDGLLNIKEFTDGIRRMKGEAKAKDIFDVIKKLETTDRRHKELKRQADKYSETLHALEYDTAKIADDISDVVALFQECYHRLSSHIDKIDKADELRAREEEKLAKMAAALDEEESEEETDSEEDEN